LAEGGLAPDSTLEAPYLAAPTMLAGSDFIAVLGRRLGQTLQNNYLLRICDLPFETPRVASLMHWSCLLDDDPAHAWLRRQTVEIAKPQAA
jgi:hypothetical protein